MSELRKTALLLIILMAFGIVALAYEWLSETVGRRWLTLIAVSTAVLILLAGYAAFAHDMDHPEQDEWYRTLMQPDNPSGSCCGEADAYWCDGLHVRDGKNYCVITDDRVVPNRTPVPVGTQIEIPDRKLKWDRGNPTGHAVVFLTSGGAVYCFVQSGGA